MVDAATSFSRGVTHLTGAFGVGSILLLSLFLLLDASTNAFAVVENSSPSRSWSLFVAVPIFFSTYVGGVIASEAGREIRGSIRQSLLSSGQRIAGLVGNNSNILLKEYEEVSVRISVLDGAFISFICLSISLIVGGIAWKLPHLGWTLGVSAMVVGATALVAAGRIERAFDGALLTSFAPKEVDE